MADNALQHWQLANPEAPGGLLQAFLDYEAALGSNDLAALDALFADSPDTLRGDPGGLLIGHQAIHDFRAARGGAPGRELVDVRVLALADDAAAVIAVTAPTTGGRGLQTQIWRRNPSGAWRVATAHVAPPPTTFDPTVWRVVGDPLIEPSQHGADLPLAGQSVAVKDVFAVAGHSIGAGVPEYLADFLPEAADSTAVAALRAAGASVRGIARTDQFAYSLAGDNPHYGTPLNPVVAGGLPGGSSSGSAVAVALGAASIGLATDTGGSVRVPASYQGLWGWRSTHGRVSSAGLLPLAVDFDTVGVLTRTGDLLATAADVLLDGRPLVTTLEGAVLAGNLPELEPGVAELFDAWVADRLPSRVDVELPDLAEAAEAFRVHQAFQAWQQHGDWLTSHPAALRGTAAERFEIASRVTADQDDRARHALANVRQNLDELLVDTVLIIPSAAGPAPKVWYSAERVDAHRTANFRLTCIAGSTGRPAVSIPLLQTPDGPLGVCVVGPRGSDEALIALAIALSKP